MSKAYSYFWGNTLVCSIVEICPIAERYGARYLLGSAFTIAAILSTVSPVGSQFLWLTIVLRFLTELVMGATYPSLKSLIANWVPPDEKGKFLSILTTGGIGTVIDWSMAGHIWLIFGSCGSVWFTTLHESPLV